MSLADQLSRLAQRAKFLMDTELEGEKGGGAAQPAGGGQPTPTSQPRPPQPQQQPAATAAVLAGTAAAALQRIGASLMTAVGAGEGEAPAPPAPGEKEPQKEEVEGGERKGEPAVAPATAELQRKTNVEAEERGRPPTEERIAKTPEELAARGREVAVAYDTAVSQLRGRGACAPQTVLHLEELIEERAEELRRLYPHLSYMARDIAFGELAEKGVIKVDEESGKVIINSPLEFRSVILTDRGTADLPEEWNDWDDRKRAEWLHETLKRLGAERAVFATVSRDPWGRERVENVLVKVEEVIKWSPIAGVPTNLDEVLRARPTAMGVTRQQLEESLFPKPVYVLRAVSERGEEKELRAPLAREEFAELLRGKPPHTLFQVEGVWIQRPERLTEEAVDRMYNEFLMAWVAKQGYRRVKAGDQILEVPENLGTGKAPVGGSLVFRKPVAVTMLHPAASPAATVTTVERRSVAVAVPEWLHSFEAFKKKLYGETGFKPLSVEEVLRDPQLYQRLLGSLPPVIASQPPGGPPVPIPAPPFSPAQLPESVRRALEEEVKRRSEEMERLAEQLYAVQLAKQLRRAGMEEVVGPDGKTVRLPSGKELEAAEVELKIAAYELAGREPPKALLEERRRLVFEGRNPVEVFLRGVAAGTILGLVPGAAIPGAPTLLEKGVEAVKGFLRDPAEALRGIASRTAPGPEWLAQQHEALKRLEAARREGKSFLEALAAEYGRPEALEALYLAGQAVGWAASSLVGGKLIEKLVSAFTRTRPVGEIVAEVVKKEGEWLAWPEGGLEELGEAVKRLIARVGRQEKVREGLEEGLKFGIEKITKEKLKEGARLIDAAKPPGPGGFKLEPLGREQLLRSPPVDATLEAALKSAEALARAQTVSRLVSKAVNEGARKGKAVVKWLTGSGSEIVDADAAAKVAEILARKPLSWWLELDLPAAEKVKLMLFAKLGPEKYGRFADALLKAARKLGLVKEKIPKDVEVVVEASDDVPLSPPAEGERPIFASDVTAQVKILSWQDAPKDVLEKLKGELAARRVGVAPIKLKTSAGEQTYWLLFVKEGNSVIGLAAVDEGGLAFLASGAKGASFLDASLVRRLTKEEWDELVKQFASSLGKRGPRVGYFVYTGRGTIDVDELRKALEKAAGSGAAAAPTAGGGGGGGGVPTPPSPPSGPNLVDALKRAASEAGEKVKGLLKEVGSKAVKVSDVVKPGPVEYDLHYDLGAPRAIAASAGQLLQQVPQLAQALAHLPFVPVVTVAEAGAVGGASAVALQLTRQLLSGEPKLVEGYARLPSGALAPVAGAVGKGGGELALLYPPGTALVFAAVRDGEAVADAVSLTPDTEAAVNAAKETLELLRREAGARPKGYRIHLGQPLQIEGKGVLLPVTEEIAKKLEEELKEELPSPPSGIFVPTRIDEGEGTATGFWIIPLPSTLFDKLKGRRIRLDGIEGVKLDEGVIVVPSMHTVQAIAPAVIDLKSLLAVTPLPTPSPDDGWLPTRRLLCCPPRLPWLPKFPLEGGAAAAAGARYAQRERLRI